MQRTIRSVWRTVLVDRPIGRKREDRRKSQVLGQSQDLGIGKGRLLRPLDPLNDRRVPDGRRAPQPARHDRQRQAIDDDGGEYPEVRMTLWNSQRVDQECSDPGGRDPRSSLLYPTEARWVFDVSFAEYS